MQRGLKSQFILSVGVQWKHQQVAVGDDDLEDVGGRMTRVQAPASALAQLQGFSKMGSLSVAGMFLLMAATSWMPQAGEKSLHL